MDNYIVKVLTYFDEGADTTSTTMSALMFYLSRYPECYKRLTEEIRAAFDSGNDIKSGPVLSYCTYLRACIDETLRLSPPVGGVLWRELEPHDKDPYVIDGHFIPPGTQVGVSIYALHHNPENFKDPFTFNPERWLLDDDASEDIKAEKRRMNDAFTAFSVGPRGCAGKAMAYMEASLTMAKMLWYCDFERSQGSLDKVGSGGAGKGQGREREKEFQLNDIMVSTHDGPYLLFKPRNEAWKEL
jgi:cytochrome P450